MRKTILRLAEVYFFTWFFFVRTETCFSFTIVKDQVPQALIIKSQNASFLENKAVLEFQEYIEKMSGARLTISTDMSIPLDNKIIIGTKDLVEDKRLIEELGKLGEEGFIIKADGEFLLIAGGGEYGVLYGVYAFLEKLGVRWFLESPLGEVVPEMKTITVDNLYEEQKPDFPMRWVGMSDWSLKNKGNCAPSGYPSAFKVYPTIYHTDGFFISREEDFRRHPEYFALIDGKRFQGGSSSFTLCVSNPEVTEVVASRIIDVFKKDKNIDLLALSPMDADEEEFCQCSECRKMDEETLLRDQKYSRRYLLFYNAVAKILEKHFPDQPILAGAYSFYTRLPKDKTIPIHKNLSFVLCHYAGYCLLHPVNDWNCPRNKQYNSIIQEYKKRGVADIYFYEYYWKIAWFDLLWPLAYSIGEDMRYYRKIGVKGMYSQYNNGNVWTSGLNYYVALKLLWDSKTDVNKLLDDFCGKLFCDSALPMKKFYDTLHNATTYQHQFHTDGEPGEVSFLLFNKDTVSRLKHFLEEAGSLAKDRQVAERIAKVQTALDYTARMAEYFWLKKEAGEAVSDNLREKAGLVLKEIYDEINSNPEKYNGVVTSQLFTPAGYAGIELRNLGFDLEPRGVGIKFSVRVPLEWRFRLDEKDQGVEERWYDPEYIDVDWSTIQIKKTWEKQGYDYNGYAWYRSSVLVDKFLQGKQLSIYFGGVDGEGWVYWNGTFIGHHKGWDEPFTLTIDPSITKYGATNTIAVRVFDGAGAGGIYMDVIVGIR